MQNIIELKYSTFFFISMKLKSFLIATWAASEGYSNNNLGKSVYLFTLVKFSHFPKCFGEIRPRHVLCKIHPHILNCWSLFEKSISNLEAISGSLEMKCQCGPAVFNINSTCDLFGTKHMCGKKKQPDCEDAYFAYWILMINILNAGWFIFLMLWPWTECVFEIRNANVMASLTFIQEWPQVGLLIWTCKVFKYIHCII